MSFLLTSQMNNRKTDQIRITLNFMTRLRIEIKYIFQVIMIVCYCYYLSNCHKDDRTKNFVSFTVKYSSIVNKLFNYSAIMLTLNVYWQGLGNNLLFIRLSLNISVCILVDVILLCYYSIILYAKIRLFSLRFYI